MIISHDVDGPEGAPAVVLLHSSVCDRRMWDPQWKPLVEAGYRVVRADFRSCGESPVGSAPYSDVGDVLDLLDHLGIGQASLVGSSYGGRVALGVAWLRSDRVSALALLCPGRPGQVAGPQMRAFGAAEDELLEAGDLDGAAALNVRTWLGPDAAEEVRELVGRMQRGNFEAGLTEGAGDFELPEPEAVLSAVTARALVVSGAHDLPDFRRIVAEVAAGLPNARALDLPWAGHLPSLERPAEITALLREFLVDAATA
ncbi:alpha/beta hydrolase [Kitasatospora sp. NPDC002965]|uniref:alpha/beta fold hydrolase n=1 Tax=Kitasatospora sp. NPDC002965 TaxID=3154775 RepID=UPI0033B9579C